MEKVDERGRKSIVRSRDHNRCYSCHDRVKAGDSDVYLLSTGKYVLLCDYCADALERLGVPDEDMYGYVGGLKVKHFLRKVEENAKNKKHGRGTSK